MEDKYNEKWNVRLVFTREARLNNMKLSSANLII